MQGIVFWATLAVLAVAVATDVRSRRIPNWLVLPFLAVGIIFSGVSGGWGGIGHSVKGIGVAVGIVGVVCYLRGLGLGDLKLCAALGAWLGPGQMIFALVATAVAGGFLAVGHGLWHGSLGRHLDGARDLVVGLVRGGFRPHPSMRLDNPEAVKLPYAVAIAIGTMFSFLAR